MLFRSCFHDVLEHAGHEAFGNGHNLLFISKAHLKVDLRKLGLTVGAQVFVAEAAHDLEVAVHDIMGDSMGPDAQKLYMGIERHLSNVEKIGFHAMRIDMQRSSLVTQKVSELWVNYERKLHGNMYLNAMAGIAFIDNADYLKGRNDKSKFVMGEVKWKL